MVKLFSQPVLSAYCKNICALPVLPTKKDGAGEVCPYELTFDSSQAFLTSTELDSGTWSPSWASQECSSLER